VYVRESVRVRVCVCVCACVYVHTCAACVRVCTRNNMYVCMYLHPYLCLYLYMHSFCMPACVFKDVYPNFQHPMLLTIVFSGGRGDRGKKREKTRASEIDLRRRVAANMVAHIRICMYTCIHTRTHEQIQIRIQMHT